MELPQFVVAARGIGENFNAVKSHKDVRADGADYYLYKVTQALLRRTSLG